MTVALKLRAVTFDRTDAGGGLACFSLRDDVTSTPTSTDWEDRPGATPVSHDVAHLSRQQTGPRRTVTAIFEALEDTAPGLRVDAVDTSGTIAITARTTSSAGTGSHLALRFELPSDFATGGISTQKIDWQWTCGEATSAMKPLGRSQHGIFVVLAEPALPWAVPDLVPWKAVMDVACRWARGATTDELVADQITAQVFGLGGQTVPLSSGGVASIAYSQSGFFPLSQEAWDLVQFLKMVNRETDARHSMNCSDAATALTLFSSALGVPLTLALITRPKCGTICTRRIRLVGLPEQPKAQFKRHEVACLRTHGTIDTIWDPCLEVDMDANPKEDPPTQLALAAGVPLDSATGVPSYRERFLISGQKERVSSPTSTGFRYPHKPPTRPAAFTPECDPTKVFHLLSGAFVSAERPGADAGQGLMQMMRSIGLNLKTLQVIAGDTVYPFMTADVPWSLPPSNWEVRTVTARSRVHAVHLFRMLAAYCDAPLSPARGLGDAAARTEAGDFFLILRGRTVIRLQADRRADGSPLAKIVDDTLSTVYLPPAPL